MTYPAANIKMNQQASSGLKESTSNRAFNLFRRVGIRGLYRGIGPNLLQVVPNVCVVFLCYELMNGFMAKRMRSQERACDK